jgi:hypothetical protein
MLVLDPSIQKLYKEFIIEIWRGFSLKFKRMTSPIESNRDGSYPIIHWKSRFSCPVRQFTEIRSVAIANKVLFIDMADKKQAARRASDRLPE